MTKHPLTRTAKVAFGINLALAIIFVLMAETTTFAQTGHIKKSQEEKAANKDETDDEYETVEVAGQQVAVDKKTGKLRQPTPEEAKALAEGMRKLVDQSTEGLTPVYHNNGMVSVDLQDRFQSVTVVKVNPDGTLTKSCVASEREADAFLGVKAESKRGSAKAIRRSSRKAYRRATRKE